MKVRKSIDIGIFVNVPGSANQRLISGFFRFASSQANWQIRQFPLQNDGDELRRIVTDYRPDALIASSPDILRAYEQNGLKRLPYVLLESVEPRYPTRHGISLNVDNIRLGLLAAQRFLSLGYRNLATIPPYLLTTYEPSLPMMERYSRLREGAFCREAASAGVPVHRCPRLVNTANVEALLVDWMKTLPLPCGVFCFGDDDARDVVRVAQQLGLRVPDDLGFLSVDNEEHICLATMPHLSSIDPDYEFGGYRAGQLLAGLLSSERLLAGTRQTYCNERVLSRGSTRSFLSEGIRVAKACEIITRDLSRVPPVDAIAAAAGVSRRVLELAFRRVLGRSVKAEITERRLQHAATLLRTTDLPVLEIGERCGYGYTAFRTAFRQRFDCPATAYRSDPPSL